MPRPWIVDPILRTLEVLCLDGDHWIVASIHGADETARVTPVDAVELRLDRWWLPASN